MTTTQHDIPTADLIASLRATIEQNARTTERFDIATAVALIKTGAIRPDWNDGAITNLSDALAFGAFISGDERIWRQS